jgi:hypothetical protein
MYEDRGQTLVLRVGTLWRCGDGPFFEVPPKHFLQRSTHFSKTCCRPLITWNILPRSSLSLVGKKQRSLGARFELNSVFGLKRVDQWNSIRTSPIQSRSRSMWFLGFSNHEKAAPGQFRNDQQSAARFREVDGALWEVHRLPTEVLRKRDRHRTSTKFRLRVIRWVHELTALVELLRSKQR